MVSLIPSAVARVCGFIKSFLPIMGRPPPLVTHDKTRPVLLQEPVPFEEGSVSDDRFLLHRVRTRAQTQPNYSTTRKRPRSDSIQDCKSTTGNEGQRRTRQRTPLIASDSDYSPINGNNRKLRTSKCVSEEGQTRNRSSRSCKNLTANGRELRSSNTMNDREGCTRNFRVLRSSRTPSNDRARNTRQLRSSNIRFSDGLARNHRTSQLSSRIANKINGIRNGRELRSSKRIFKESSANSNRGFHSNSGISSEGEWTRSQRLRALRTMDDNIFLRYLDDDNASLRSVRKIGITNDVSNKENVGRLELPQADGKEVQRKGAPLLDDDNVSLRSMRKIAITNAVSNKENVGGLELPQAHGKEVPGKVTQLQRSAGADPIFVQNTKSDPGSSHPFHRMIDDTIQRKRMARKLDPDYVKDSHREFDSSRSNDRGEGEMRKSERRRISNRPSLEYDTSKETGLLQQAIRASMITQHEKATSDIPEAPVFYPTTDEFRDPYAYVEKIRDQVEFDFGICKIVPPSDWNPPLLFENNSNRFRTRIQHIHRLQEGLGFDFNEYGFNLDEYRNMADAFFSKYFNREPGELTADEIEEHYWKIVRTSTPETVVEYGNDLDAARFGSGFPTSGSNEYVSHPWNLNNIARLPGSAIRKLEAGISGVTVPWVYIGMLFSSFCWHAEDLWMYSISYNHFGASKSWYAAPGGDHKKIEAAMKTQVPELFEDEPDLAMQLVTQMLPATLMASNVSVVHAVQREGEFIITFPRAFHAGFNHGFNCTEAVNFAMLDWLHHGRYAVDECRKHFKPALVSVDKLLIEIVETDACFLDKKFLQSQLTILIKEERGWRSYWTRAGVEQWCILPRADALDTCELCKQFCYLSYLKCKCDSNRIICLHHVDISQEGCQCEISQKSAFFRYEMEELDALNDSLTLR